MEQQQYISELVLDNKYTIPALYFSMDLTYIFNCFICSLNFIFRYEFSQVVDFITQMTDRHRDRALKIKESGVPADFFCKIPFLTKGDIAYKLKKIYTPDSKFVFDENSKNCGKLMRNFV